MLGIGANVRCHDIDLRPDEGRNFLSEATGEALLFGHAELAWVTGNAALAAAVGEAHEGAFPVHPHREGGDFADVDLGVEAEAALDRSA